MKKILLLSLFWLGVASISQADVVTELFEVGAPFSSGIVGTSPGDQETFSSRFASSTFTSGHVEIRDSHQILAGIGDAFFVPDDAQSTYVEFDMGFQMNDTTTANASLIDSEIRLMDIHQDVDADNFVFNFTAIYLDGSAITDLSDLTITTTNSTFNFSPSDGGSFRAELVSGSGIAEISFKANGGEILRGVNFQKIGLDVADDQLRVRGSRTLNISSVPEPGPAILLALTLGLFSMQRRRRTPATDSAIE